MVPQDFPGGRSKCIDALQGGLLITGTVVGSAIQGAAAA